MKTINFKNIKNYTEKTWFLGTDILSQDDLLILTDDQKCTAVGNHSTILNVNVFLEFHADKISNNFLGILKEAKKRKYQYLFFDADIETEFVSEDVMKVSLDKIRKVKTREELIEIMRIYIKLNDFKKLRVWEAAAVNSVCREIAIKKQWDFESLISEAQYL